MAKDSVRAGTSDGHLASGDAGLDVNPADTLHRILKLSNKLMAPFSTYLERRYKISVNEFRLLMLIGRLGVTASHELADATGVNVMSVSRAVAALQRHGRITVTRDPANLRRKQLTLTDEGQRLFELMRPHTDIVAEYLLSALRPEEVADLNRYLETLTATLEASDEMGRSVFLERTRPRDGEDGPAPGQAVEKAAGAHGVASKRTKAD